MSQEQQTGQQGVDTTMPSHTIEMTRINADIRAARFGRPSKAVKPLAIDRRVVQFQAASSLSGATND